MIVPAERMNAAAANALLKTLEEPPPSTFLILVSAAPGRLPRDACAAAAARWRRRGPTPATARAWLAAQGVPDPPTCCSRRPAGAPLAALRARRRRLSGRARRMARGARGARRPWPRRRSPSASTPRRAKSGASGSPNAIDWLVGWCGDLAHVRRGRDAAPQRGSRRGARAPRPFGGADRAVSLSSCAPAAARARRASADAAARRRGAPHRLPDPVSLIMADKAPPRRQAARAPRARACCRSTSASGRRCMRRTCRSCAAAASSSRRRARTRSARKCSCCCR